MAAVGERLPVLLDQDAVRRAGVVCLVAGALGAASGIFLAVVPAQVGPERYSYPLAAGGYIAFQAFFCLQHLGLVVGLLGLRRSGVAGGGTLGAWGLAAAIAGMSLLALVELVAISAARSSVSGPPSAMLNVLYGVTSILTGLGLVLAGVAVRRARRWTGWRGWLVLALGVYVFVPLTPALAGPFAVARIAITVWMLVFAVLGGVLATTREQS